MRPLIVTDLAYPKDAQAVLGLFRHAKPYFMALNGRAASVDDAEQVLTWAPERVGSQQKRVEGYWLEGKPGRVLVGCCDYWVGWPAAGALHINLLLIHPAARFQGYGTWAVQRLVQKARDTQCEMLELAVVEGNARADSFWQDQGFARTLRALARERPEKTHLYERAVNFSTQNSVGF